MLLSARNLGKRQVEVYFEAEFFNLDVTDLLKGVEPAMAAVAAERSTSAPPSLFVSYSHVDEHHRQQLDVRLTVMRKRGLALSWHDRMIRPGDDWSTEIRAQIDRAQIVVFLVSDDFLASDYCTGIEAKRAMERRSVGECVVVPIVLRPCLDGWEQQLGGSFQALPSGARPVTSWPSTDDAWKDVGDALAAIATRLMRS